MRNRICLPRAFRFPIVLVLASIIFNGCSKTDPASPPSTGSTTVPAIGSRFIFDTFSVDTNDVEEQATRAFDTVTVVQSGLNTGGKRDVRAMRYSSSGELAYIHYESNGDIAFALDHSDGIWPAWTWHTFPVGSAGKNIGAIVEDNSSGQRVVYTDTLIYLGREDITVGGKIVNCARVREQVVAFDYSGTDITDRTEYLEDYWFAPSLGFFMRYSDDARTFDEPTGAVIWKREDYRMSLTEYALK